MGWGRKLLGGIGTVAGIIALISLGITIVVFAAMYIVGFNSLNLPVMGMIVLYAPAGVTLAGFGIWVVSKIGVRLLGGSSTTAPETAGGHTAESVGEASRETPASQLREFNKANLYVAIIFGFLFVLAAAAGPLRTAVAGTPVGVVVNFLVFAAEITGGTTMHAINLAWFGVAWFGISRYRATEAWLLGVIGWSLIALSGIYLLSVSIGAIALAIGGAKVVSIGYKARGSTEMRFLDEYVEQARENAANTSGMSAAGNETSDTEGTDVFSVVSQRVADRDIRSLEDILYIVDVEPEFVHPREAKSSRLMYWSTLSYALGGLMIVSSLLVGIEIWGFPSLGVWGILIGAVYVGHGFGVPQDSAFVHVGGIIWYGFMGLVGVLTLSPLAVVVNAAGVYLGWTTAEGIQQPDEVFANLMDPDADATGTGIVGSGLAGGVVIGGILGLLGAAVFAWVSVETQTVYGLLLLLPAVASGVGVAVGAGEQSGRVSGLLSAGVAVGSILVGFRLLSAWMPQGYQLEPSFLLAIVPLVGIYLAYKVGSSPDVGSVGSSETDSGTGRAGSKSVDTGSDN